MAKFGINYNYVFEVAEFEYDVYIEVKLREHVQKCSFVETTNGIKLVKNPS